MEKLLMETFSLKRILFDIQLLDYKAITIKCQSYTNAIKVANTIRKITEYTVFSEGVGFDCLVVYKDGPFNVFDTIIHPHGKPTYFQLEEDSFTKLNDL